MGGAQFKKEGVPDTSLMAVPVSRPRSAHRTPSCAEVAYGGAAFLDFIGRGHLGVSVPAEIPESKDYFLDSLDCRDRVEFRGLWRELFFALSEIQRVLLELRHERRRRIRREEPV